MRYQYYAKRTATGLYELRQVRYRHSNHPHDVCAVSRDLQEMHQMVAAYFPVDEVDFSGVEGANAIPEAR